MNWLNSFSIAPAMPPDVRKRSALPSHGVTNPGLRPKTGRSPRLTIEFAGRPQAFRTSGVAQPQL